MNAVGRHAIETREAFNRADVAELVRPRPSRVAMSE
jgi:hypothetical protein